MLHMYECIDHSCISIDAVCDGTKDCPNGEDEKCDDFCKHNGYHVGLKDCGKLCPPGVCECDASYFQCKMGGCVQFDRVCDYIADCPDRSDEAYCGKTELHAYKKLSEDFLCGDSITSIAYRLVDDLIPDCPDGSDEKFEIISTQSPKYQKSICNNTHFACHPYHQRCYHSKFKCQYDLDDYLHLKHCRNAAHLVDCRWSVCHNNFKCLNSYCIPLHRVCDKSIDCPLHDDEQDCGELQCPGLFRCKAGVCLHPDLLCDGEENCPIYGDDETYCDQQKCPANCKCSGHTLVCDTILGSLNQQFAKKLIVTGINSIIDGSALEGMSALLWADLSNNSILYLPTEPKTLFRDQNLLFNLDISNNKISHIPHKCFTGLNQLRFINLEGNPITEIGSNVLPQSIHIERLAIQSIQDIRRDSLQGLKNLRTLNINSLNLNYLPYGFFSSMVSLKELSVYASEKVHADLSLFKSIHGLKTLHTNYPQLCCLSDNPDVCKSRGGHARCTSLLQGIHGVLTWCESFHILIFNGLGIFLRFMNKLEPDSVIIFNLHMADFIMALYLVGLSIASVILGETFAINEHHWFRSNWCAVLSILSSTSVGVSNALTMLISVERYRNIRHFSKFHMRSAKTTWLLCWCIWLVFILFSFLPFIVHILLKIPYPVINRYCLQMNFFTDEPPLQLYQFVIHGVLNSIFGIVTSVCYYQIYRSCLHSAKSLEEIGGLKYGQHVRSFKKIPALMVSTNATALALNFVFIASMLPYSIHWSIAKWVMVTILPLNSIINPFVHTISSYTFSHMKFEN